MQWSNIGVSCIENTDTGEAIPGGGGTVGRAVVEARVALEAVQGVAVGTAVGFVADVVLRQAPQVWAHWTLMNPGLRSQCPFLPQF